MLVFCTLFDSNYLDKGLVMYDSLCKAASDFKLYILAMNQKCFEVLNDLSYKNVVVIGLEQFLNDELKAARENRSQAEFCWTCTASLIKHILDFYKEKICTYIDADLYFYKNPEILINEMFEANASVQIVEHRFDKSHRNMIEESGKYCVQFNTFINNADGRRILEKWAKQTLEECSSEHKQGGLGDQRYLNNWTQEYKGVHELQHHGGGVAPWNINRYSLTKKNENICIRLNKTNKIYDLIFYHFHSVTYSDNDVANIDVHHRYWKIDSDLVDEIYLPYLKEIQQKKKFLLDNYSIYPLLKNHPAYKESDMHTKIYRFLRRSLRKNIRIIINKLRYKLKIKHDLIDLNKI